MADDEANLISKAVREADLRPALDSGIKLAFFEDPEHAMVWGWALEHLSNYGVSPGIEALRAEYPEYRLAKTPEPFEYYIDRLRKKRRFSLVVSTIESMREPLDADDPETAVKILATSLEELQAETSSLGDHDTTHEASARLAVYEEIALRGSSLLGLPSGFPTLDRATGGFQPEQLVTIVGLPKSGKSTIALLSAIAAHKVGARPMFVSFEMSTKEQEMRSDAFRAQISYHNLLHGQLSGKEKAQLSRMLRGLEAMPPFWFEHDPSTASTVSMLSSKVSQFKPDLLVVDGVYLMEAENTSFDPGSPQALTSITRGLKRLAQRASIPVLATTQVLYSKYQKSKGPTAQSIGYTSSYAQDSDVIIGQERDPEDPNSDTFLKVVLSRNCPSGVKARINWDWEESDFSELEYYEDEESAPEGGNDQ